VEIQQKKTVTGATLQHQQNNAVLNTKSVPAHPIPALYPRGTAFEVEYPDKFVIFLRIEGKNSGTAS
jgi:hypothetical protein